MSFNKIILDHIYTTDYRHSFFKELGKLGFTLSEQRVEHPGKHYCTFIMLDNFQYLEFIDIGKGGIDYKRPGLSFRFEKQLESYYRSLKKRAYFGCIYGHKNYQWKKNSIDRLPGWNFLTFKNLGFRTLYPWFTEYEEVPGYKISKNSSYAKAKHLNGVKSLYGLEIDLNEKGEKYFQTIFNKKIKGQMTLSNGQVIYFNRCQKRTRLKTVLLKTRSLKKTQEYIKGDVDFFHEHKGIFIKNPCPHPMWDIFIFK